MVIEENRDVHRCAKEISPFSCDCDAQRVIQFNRAIARQHCYQLTLATQFRTFRIFRRYSSETAGTGYRTLKSIWAAGAQCGNWRIKFNCEKEICSTARSMSNYYNVQSQHNMNYCRVKSRKKALSAI